MADWMDRVVQRLTPADNKPIIAIDPTRILRYPECANALKDSGYQIIYTDPGLDFRFTFELNARGKQQIIVVVETEYEPLPDIACDAVVINASLQEAFPHFDSKALRDLSFNALCTIDSLRIFEDLGYEGTLKFLLENLYHIDLFALKSHQTKERVLGILIMVIFHRDPPNESILRFLRELSRPVFGQQLVSIVTDSNSLREYLQGEWEKMTHGSSTINFSDPILEKAINQLFISGILNPVKVSSSQKSEIGFGQHIGIEVDQTGERSQRFAQLLDHLEERVGNIQNIHLEWQALSPVLGEVGILADAMDDVELKEKYQDLINRLNQRFQIFVKGSFSSLQSLSGTRYPATIHKIMDYLKAQSQAHGSNQKAFIMLDGMSVIQWYLLRTALSSLDIPVQDLASFAWLPSITAWSRQAFFRGSKPDLAVDNSQEEKYFREYWAKAGELSYQIEYSIFGVDNQPKLPAPDSKVVAFVCNDLDNLMHGAIMGTEQLHQNTSQWIEKSGITGLVESLKKDGYSICISSDHGNICATGIVSLKLSDRQSSRSRSKRHLYCVNNEEAQRFKERHPKLNLAVLGSSVYFTDDSAFELEGKTIITHGGSHLLELLIPVGVIL